MNTAIKLLVIALMSLLLASPVFAGGNFTISADGAEVTDNKTGLIWRRCSEGQHWNGSACMGTALTYTHEAALTQARTQTDWRLPNVKELASIVDRSRIKPSIDVEVFPDTSHEWYWTSSPYADYPSSAWYVCFEFGDIGSYGRNYKPNYVRLVR